MNSAVSILAVAIGVVGALLGVYFREAVRRAYRQKEVAAKLDAQLSTIRATLIENEQTLSLLVMGEIWSKERITALVERGKAGYIEVENKYKKKLKEARAEFLKGDKDIDRQLNELHRRYREMPERVFAYHLQQFELCRDLLLNERGLITDDEAALLSWHAVHRVVRLRTYLTKLVHLNLLVAIQLREMSEFQPWLLREAVFDAAEESLRVAIEVTPLQELGEATRKRSVSSLVLRDLTREP